MRIALVQCCSGTDPEANLRFIEAAVARAASEGARLVCLPENSLLTADAATRVGAAQPLNGPWALRLGALAAAHGLWLNAGGFPEATAVPGKSGNTSLLFDPQGTLVAAYRKLHLFDIDLDTVRFAESASTVAGDAVVVADVDGVKVGLSVCYDLRFPELYRALVDQGAQVLLVPAAFTVPTGAAHWHVLLRARAIESQCWVVAAAQTGAHPGTDRRSYGHSLAVDPWGTVRLDLGEATGVAFVDVNLSAQAEVRARLPALNHRRPAAIYGR